MTTGAPGIPHTTNTAPQPHARRRRFGNAAVFGTAAVVVGVLTALTACEDTKERAVDCGHLAISVHRAVDELERAAMTAALDEDPEQFTDAVREDAERVSDRTSDVEVRQAADSVLAAVDNVGTAVVDGTDPDLAPLTDAAGELTRVCTPTPPSG